MLVNLLKGVKMLDPPRSWKYCRDCDQHSPPRTHHCSLCNFCVKKQDHHCFFLTKCVNLHNQRYFVPFLLVILLSVFVNWESIILFAYWIFIKMTHLMYYLLVHLFSYTFVYKVVLVLVAIYFFLILFWWF